MRPGFILLEAAVTILILCVAIVALLPVFAMSLKAGVKSEKALAAAHLALELMEEVKLRKWDEASYSGRLPVSDPGPLGVDAGEDRADKRSFDDIDDFDGWTEETPMDPVMRRIEGFPDMSRSVSVRFVADELEPSAVPSDLKAVSVCVRSKNVTWTCLDRVFANR
ncbi:MAG: type II secretion system protein [Elusimicrobia bacterium]|nr:type II secretion system protein [Elusimicrobiota bacterium]